MATPIAHSLAGWSLCLLLGRPVNLRWQDALLAAAWTVVPDLDLVAILFVGLPEGHYWHHTVTHSLGFALLAGVVLALVSTWFRGRLAWGEAVLVALLIASHAVVDYFTFDGSWPYGVPMFWPLSTEFYLAPYTPLLNIERGSLQDLFGSHNARAVLGELLVFVPVLVLSLLYWRWRGPWVVRDGSSQSWRAVRA